MTQGATTGTARRFLSFVIFSVGVVATIIIIVSFFGIPGVIIKNLNNLPYSDKADFILLLPGGGVPSPATLQRAYFGAEEQKKNSRSKIVISLKAPDPIEKSSAWEIRNELITRGVSAKNILFERKARNTAEHALYISQGGFGDPSNNSYLLVTSPTHMPRAWLTFKAKGFKHLYAAPAFGKDVKEDLGGQRAFRYDFWNELLRSISIIREAVAIGWYRFKGYI